jgi:hypothetical protein
MNDVSLHDYVDRRLRDLEKRLEIIAKLNRVAVDKAADMLNVRLESMNEFRAQMKDQQSTYATSKELRLLEKAIQNLEVDRAVIEGKANQKSVMIAYIISAIGILIAIVSLLK